MTRQAWDQGDQEQFRSELQATIDAFLDEQADRLAPLGDDAARLVAEARVAVTGGKRFRAAFCYWGFRAAAREEYDERAVLRASAALELLHASALVHDDLMDASDTRRGRPATHRGFAALHQQQAWPGDPDQYGASAAILLGDLLLSWSDELLRRCGLPWDRVGPALEVLDACRSEVIAGQFLDVSVQARGRADVDTAMTVLRYKSAKYSIERPVHIGAALAGAGPDMVEELSRFGLPLGEAFQLRDDILGTFGDQARTGKPVGDDLREGKPTPLLAIAVERTGAADAELLARVGQVDLGPDEVTALQRLFEECGAREEIESSIAELTAEAVASLDEAPLEPGAVSALRELASYVAARDT